MLNKTPPSVLRSYDLCYFRRFSHVNMTQIFSAMHAGKINEVDKIAVLSAERTTHAD